MVIVPSRPFPIPDGIAAQIPANARRETTRPRNARSGRGNAPCAVAGGGVAYPADRDCLFAGWLSYQQHVADARDRLDRDLGRIYEHALKVFETFDLCARYLDELLGASPRPETASDQTQFKAQAEIDDRPPAAIAGHLGRRPIGRTARLRHCLSDAESRSLGPRLFSRAEEECRRRTYVTEVMKAAPRIPRSSPSASAG